MAQPVQVQTLLEPVVEGLGYELLGVEYLRGGRGMTLRLYIDRLQGITLEDCETVSRQVSAVLDVEDVMRGQYTLEISSPGLDRRLFKPAHYRRFVGEVVRLRLSEPMHGRRKVTGKLEGVEDEVVVVNVEGQAYRIPFQVIARGNLKPLVEGLHGARR
ncbi:MAG: ribosome maturation factor RimP [Chromatiales bacterium]